MPTNVGVISQSYATGPVTGGDASIVGGLAGINFGTINQSFAAGAVSGGASSSVGGLVAVNFGIPDSQTGLITKSYATGSVTGGNGSFVGGLVAANLGTINQSFAGGAVTGGDNSTVGGLVAVNFGAPDLGTGNAGNPQFTLGVTGVISQAYATGAVTGGANSTVGGLVAFNGGTIDQTYSIGKVTGGPGSTLGGLVAVNSASFDLPIVPLPDGSGSSASANQQTASAAVAGTVTNSYWDVITSGLTNSAAGAPFPQGNGLPPGFGAPWDPGTDPNLFPTLPGLPGVVVRRPPLPGPTPPVPGPPPLLPPPPIVVVNALTANLPVPNNLQLVMATQVDPQPTTPDPVVKQSDNQGSGGGTGGTTGSTGGGQAAGNGPLRPDGRPSFVPPIDENRFINNEVVFQICSDGANQRVQAHLRRLGLNLLSTQSIGLLGCTVYHSRITSGRSVRDVITALERDRLIDAATPNYMFQLAQAATAPAGGDPAQYTVSKLRLAEVHQLAKGDNVRVAVIDSEIDAKHPDLEGAIAARYEAGGAADRPHPHGTGMAGAIASHRKLMGVAPGRALLAIRAFGADRAAPRARPCRSSRASTGRSGRARKSST